jgi:hypothetical protein
MKHTLRLTLKPLCLLLFSLFICQFALAEKVWQESGGLVVIEMENTDSPLDTDSAHPWITETSLSGYTGSGYLQFLGNTTTSGPAKSPVEFSFKINQSGLYYLHLHCAKQIVDGRTDLANDGYVRVEGDYTAGAGPYTSHGDNASLALLQNNTKYYGGAADAWKWENGQGNLDPGGHNNKRNAVYNFKAGETYKLVVSGRSKLFRINRMMFRLASVNTNNAQNLATPESEFGPALVYEATTDFPNIDAGEVPYYKETRPALAIDAANVAYRDKFARAQRTFDGAAGNYDVTITALRELDGECTYQFLVNGSVVGTAQNSTTDTDYAPEDHVFRNITIPAGATIAVESKTDSNGAVLENPAEPGVYAWARGRWTQVEFSTATILPGPDGAHAIPGQIESEDYNFGGEGVGYHDTTAGNSGGQYREDNVDIQTTSEGGYLVGWTTAGESLISLIMLVSRNLAPFVVNQLIF